MTTQLPLPVIPSGQPSEQVQPLVVACEESADAQALPALVEWRAREAGGTCHCDLGDTGSEGGRDVDKEIVRRMPMAGLLIYLDKASAGNRSADK